jgi:hypothetical protein
MITIVLWRNIAITLSLTPVGPILDDRNRLVSTVDFPIAPYPAEYGYRFLLG